MRGIKIKLKGYVILARNKETNDLFGLCYESGICGRGYVWSTDSAFVFLQRMEKSKVEFNENMLRKTRDFQKQFPYADIFLSRVSSNKCPVKIDWTPYLNKLKTNKRAIKQHAGNLTFSMGNDNN